MILPVFQYNYEQQVWFYLSQYNYEQHEVWFYLSQYNYEQQEVWFYLSQYNYEQQEVWFYLLRKWNQPPGEERRGQIHRSTTDIERTRWSHCQSVQHGHSMFHSNAKPTWKTSEKQDGAHLVFPERQDIILNWTELRKSQENGQNIIIRIIRTQMQNRSMAHLLESTPARARVPSGRASTHACARKNSSPR